MEPLKRLFRDVDPEQYEEWMFLLESRAHSGAAHIPSEDLTVTLLQNLLIYQTCALAGVADVSRAIVMPMSRRCLNGRRSDERAEAFHETNHQSIVRCRCDRRVAPAKSFLDSQEAAVRRQSSHSAGEARVDQGRLAVTMQPDSPWARTRSRCPGDGRKAAR